MISAITCHWHDSIIFDGETTHFHTHERRSDSTFSQQWNIKFIRTRHRQTLDNTSLLTGVHLLKNAFVLAFSIYRSVLLRSLLSAFDWRNVRAQFHSIPFLLTLSLYEINETWIQHVFEMPSLNNVFMYALLELQTKEEQRVYQHFSAILHKYIFVCAVKQEFDVIRKQSHCLLMFVNCVRASWVYFQFY